VEINHTFYRMPSERTLEGWASQVPAGFQFALKANQKITHMQKLRDSADTVRRFLEAAAVMSGENRLGPILFQLPPSFRADLTLLEEFLALRPTAFRFAVEFRHPTWHTEETYGLLRKHGAALCLAETDKEKAPEALTADFTYLRLRRESYTPRELAAWQERCDGWLRRGIDVYAYFKHEEAGKAPRYAERLLSASSRG
jgi:uncharacterized protein YecE (DUF72 family)